jgi:methionyl aminopeptidase
MITVKKADELARMRASCRIAADVRDKISRSLCPGAATGELDEYAAELIKGHGAESAFLGYRGYPGHVCLSVNEEVVHGIPGKRRVRVGDIVSVDVGVRYGGFIGDTAATVMVGVTDLEVVRLVETSRAALTAGMEQACEGHRLTDISHAIESVAVAAGFSVVRQFVGHGIGRDMHEEPQIPNFGPAGKGPWLKAGMTLALEPMVNMGAAAVEIQDDGWTVLTADRTMSAHFEHTIAVRSEGLPEVLT